MVFLVVFRGILRSWRWHLLGRIQTEVFRLRDTCCDRLPFLGMRNGDRQERIPPVERLEHFHCEPLQGLGSQRHFFPRKMALADFQLVSTNSENALAQATGNRSAFIREIRGRFGLPSDTTESPHALQRDSSGPRRSDKLPQAVDTPTARSGSRSAHLGNPSASLLHAGRNRSRCRGLA